MVTQLVGLLRFLFLANPQDQKRPALDSQESVKMLLPFLNLFVHSLLALRIGIQNRFRQESRSVAAYFAQRP